MDKYQEDALQSLRNAADQDEWLVCRENIGKLILTLEPVGVMKIVVKQAQRFLTDLSHFHPQDEDLPKAIEALADISSLETLDQQGRVIDTILQNYWNWPGVSNFRNSLKGISKPEQYYEHSGEYKDTIVSLISAMLMANATSSYWGGNPEFSATFFGADTRKSLLMLVKANKDPKNVAIRKALWTQIADEIEMLF